MALEQVEKELRAHIPDAWVRLRVPRNPAGEWWLDVKHEGVTIAIAWSPKKGFGLSVLTGARAEAYGEGHDETFAPSDGAALVSRALRLLK